MIDFKPDLLRQRAMARVGRTIREKYRLQRLLGVGGMGAVYAASHRNGLRVALKIIHEQFSAEPDACRSFKREALLANRVDHPGIVRVLDDDVTEDGAMFLVMPLLSGETVHSRWSRAGRRMTVREALIATYAVLDVLVAAHAERVVHRDIKPENVFITSEGELRVLDFGVARLLEGGEGPASSRTGRPVGTPEFMSPEQALGRPWVDEKSDLWAVGAMAFTCLSGEHVHGSADIVDLLLCASTRPARSIRQLRPDLDEAVGAIVDRALAFDRNDRWPSAREFRDRLAAAYARVFDEPIAAPPRLAPPPRGGRIRYDALAGGVDLHSAITRAPPVSNLVSRGAPVDLEAARRRAGVPETEPPARATRSRWRQTAAIAIVLAALALLASRLFATLPTRHSVAAPRAAATAAALHASVDDRALAA